MDQKVEMLVYIVSFFIARWKWWNYGISSTIFLMQNLLTMPSVIRYRVFNIVLIWLQILNVTKGASCFLAIVLSSLHCKVPNTYWLVTVNLLCSQVTYIIPIIIRGNILLPQLMRTFTIITLSEEIAQSTFYLHLRQLKCISSSHCNAQSQLSELL